MVEYVPPKLFNDVARGLLGVTSDNPERSLPLTGAGQVVAVADTGLHEAHPDFAGRIDRGRRARPAERRVGPARSRHPRRRLGARRRFRVGRHVRRGGAGSQAVLPVAARPARRPRRSAGLAGGPVRARLPGRRPGPQQQLGRGDGVGVHRGLQRRRRLRGQAPRHADRHRRGQRGHRGEPVQLRAGLRRLALDRLAGVVQERAHRRRRAQQADHRRAVRTHLWQRLAWRLPEAADRRSRQLSGDPEAMAAFSSRGPCDDRRIKPDIVAPGTDIVSTKSELAPDDHFWGLVDDNPAYAYMGGTSMACPLVAGCATLVRQYFVDERDTSPSAALLKATLVNGARWLTGADSIADRGGAAELPPGLRCGQPDDHHPQPGRAGPAAGVRRLLGDTEPPARRDRRAAAVPGGRRSVGCRCGCAWPTPTCRDVRCRTTSASWCRTPTAPRSPGTLGLPDITKSDVDNNVEVIRVDDPAPGRWLIQVFARNLLRPPQDYALVVSGALSSNLRRAPG